MASGTVYRRVLDSGAKTWVAHITWREGGRRRQAKRSFASKKEAQNELTRLLASHQSGTFVAPSRMTVSEFVDPWLSGLQNSGLRHTTLRGYRSAMRNYVIPDIGAMQLQQIRTTDLDAMYASLLRRGLSLMTVHHAHRILSKMLTDAERIGIVERNVARMASAPSLTTARARGPEMKVWTPDELAVFLASIAGNRNEALFRLMALTGIRRSEAVGLRWSDIALERRRMTVNQAATVIDGEEYIEAPKSRRSRRVIDLDDETVAVLQRHRVRQAELYLRLGVSASASGRVFTNEIGDPIRPGSVGQAFLRLVRAVELPEIRLHDLRHTHASHLLMAGTNIKVVSERLGHASAGFTLDTYAHVMPGQQAEAAAAVAALLTR